MMITPANLVKNISIKFIACVSMLICASRWTVLYYFANILNTTTNKHNSTATFQENKLKSLAISFIGNLVMRKFAVEVDLFLLFMDFHKRIAKKCANFEPLFLFSSVAHKLCQDRGRGRGRGREKECECVCACVCEWDCKGFSGQLSPLSGSVRQCTKCTYLYACHCTFWLCEPNLHPTVRVCVPVCVWLAWAAVKRLGLFA